MHNYEDFVVLSSGKSVKKSKSWKIVGIEYEHSYRAVRLPSRGRHIFLQISIGPESQQNLRAMQLWRRLEF